MCHYIASDPNVVLPYTKQDVEKHARSATLKFHYDAKNIKIKTTAAVPEIFTMANHVDLPVSGTDAQCLAVFVTS